MKNTSVILIIFLIHFGVKAQWQQVGSTNLSSTVTENISMDIDNAGILYCAYKPFSDNYLFVKKYAGGTWLQVGSSASTEAISEGNMVVGSDGLPVVVYRNFNDSIVVRKFDGTDWQTLGAGPFAKGDSPRIEVNSANVVHVVFNNKAVFPGGSSVFKFEGNLWTPLHTQYIENLQVSYLDIAFDSNDNAVVSYRRESTGQMSVYKSNGSIWQPIGNTLFTPVNVFFGRLAIDQNDIPFITFSNPNLNNAGSVMYFDGSAWVYLGAPAFTIDPVYFSALVFDDLNTPFIAYQNGTTKLMQFNGASWVQVADSPGLGSEHDLIFNQYGNPVLAYTNIYQNYNLTVKQLCTPISVTQEITLCFGEIYEIEGQIFDEVGTYQVNLLSASGCDSIVNLNVTVLPLNNFNQSATICAGDIFTVGTTQYDQSGVFTNYLQSIDGCDSMVITNLTVQAPIETQQSVEICSGESFQVGTTVYTASGTYNDILQSAQGCDSLVITYLTVQAPIETQQSVEICSGESFQVGTTVYTSSGTYNDILQSVEGCDSLVITDLTVLAPIETQQTVEICSGESFQVGTTVYTASGTYNEIIQSIEGCDSTVTTVLIVKDPIDLSIDLTGNVLTANTAGATYQWLDCDNGNAIIVGETNQSYTPANTGNYAVELTQNSCVDTSACFLVDYSGIKDLSSTSLLVYPNPSIDGHFSIQFDGAITAIELFDIAGRSILISYAIEKGTINASALESGKYLIRIYSNKGVFNEQLVIAK